MHIFSSLKKYLPYAILLQPLALFAQEPDVIDSRVRLIKDTFDAIIPFLFIIATVIFIWGIITYIAQADDEAARKKAKALMLWGIIGLAVITAVWGVVNIILSYFGIGDVTSSFVPAPDDLPIQ